MSKSKKPKYCWDTTVFLAWLNQEKAAPLDDIALVVDQITKNEAILLVAVTTYTEIVRAKHTAEQIDLFDRFLERSNVRRIDTTFPIAKRAEEIRSRAIRLARKGARRNIRTPDATIIATAIVHKADALHTLEERLLSLNGSPIVDGLRITKPMGLGGERSLPLDESKEPSDLS